MVPSTFTLNREFNAFHLGKFIKTNVLTDFPDKYVILVFYPYDFTIVCPTEINALVDLCNKGVDDDIVVLLVSGDSVYSHKAWTEVPRDKKGIEGCNLIMIGDYEKELAQYFGVCTSIEKCGDKTSGKTETTNNSTLLSNPSRSTVILNKKMEVIHSSFYKAEIGRNTSEMFRIVAADKEFEKSGEMCECNWKSQ